jgi:hypothetical protein
MDLFKDCSLLKEFIPNYKIANFFSFSNNTREKIKLIIDILKPSTWKDNHPETEKNDYNDYDVATFLNTQWTLEK